MSTFHLDMRHENIACSIMIFILYSIFFMSILWNIHISYKLYSYNNEYNDIHIRFNNPYDNYDLVLSLWNQVPP